MKTAGFWIGCLVALPLVGTLPRSVPKSWAIPPAPTKESSTNEARYQALSAEGVQLLRQGRYAAAHELFESSRQTAIAARRTDLTARAIGNIAGSEFGLHAYRRALHSYLEARRIAESVRDKNAVAVYDANIASLYSYLGEVDSAIQWLRGGIERLGADLPNKLPPMQIEMGSLLIRQAIQKSAPRSPDPGRIEIALEMFRRGIAGADRAHDPVVYAIGWQRLGEELLRQRDLRGAERAFLEAYRVRKLNHLPLDASYWALGELHLAQGDLVSASTLLDRAVALTRSARGPLPHWRIYDTRGRVRMAQGRLPEAVADLRVAVRLARADRWSAPADDAARVGAEGVLDQVHSDLIEAANRLYIETRNPALVRETFEAAEENRANSLRQKVRAHQRQKDDLPPAYWEAVARLQRAETASLRGSDPAAEGEADATRAELVRLEASLNSDSLPLTANLMDRSQAALGSDDALLSFHLGKSISWLWALDRGTIVLYALPPRDQVEAEVQQSVRAIRANALDAAPGARLYRTLFGELAPRFQRKTRWLLALDETLLEAPVAALTDDTGTRPVFVAEQHALGVIPGAGYWLESASRQDPEVTAPLFLGIGDPIYNAADPRISQARGKELVATLRFEFLALSGTGASSSLALPRLVGSGPELDRCSAAWRGERMLLKGADASRRNLMEQLHRNPAVVHFATHVLESAQRPTYGLIALSLNEQSDLELLQPVDIAGWRVRAGLVVLSGCHSSAGSALPGTGLLGLTRSWLIAGAQSVLASHWATPDEEGDLFQEFYRTLSTQHRRDPAQALRDAQVQMIRSGDWHSQPRYWGAYFVVGNQ